MTTLTKLVEDEALKPLTVFLDGAEQPLRCIYGTQEFIEWLENVEETQPEHSLSPMTLTEQIDAMFYEYISGQSMNWDKRFKQLNNTPNHHIWQFKTPDLRMFGWIPQKDHFILAYGELKETLVKLNSYETRMAQTKHVRDDILNLSEPIHVTSRKYEDVLSDKD